MILKNIFGNLVFEMLVLFGEIVFQLLTKMIELFTLQKNKQCFLEKTKDLYLRKHVRQNNSFRTNFKQPKIVCCVNEPKLFFTSLSIPENSP